VPGQERHHLRTGLQDRHVGVEIDPVQALDIQHHMPVEHVIHRDNPLVHSTSVRSSRRSRDPPRPGSDRRPSHPYARTKTLRPARTLGGPRLASLLLLQHFRGNLDNWDPALVDALTSPRRVTAFDNAGVGGSTGTTPDTIEQMARDAIAFIGAMQFSRVDLLGFSIGSFVAQQIALVRPAIVRRLILASSAPQGATGF
jgi:pimeloyl-ACP methyl ester carboxylesterase